MSHVDYKLLIRDIHTRACVSHTYVCVCESVYLF